MLGIALGHGHTPPLPKVKEAGSARWSPSQTRTCRDPPSQAVSIKTFRPHPGVFRDYSRQCLGDLWDVRVKPRLATPTAGVCPIALAPHRHPYLCPPSYRGAAALEELGHTSATIPAGVRVPWASSCFIHPGVTRSFPLYPGNTCSRTSCEPGQGSPPEPAPAGAPVWQLPTEKPQRCKKPFPFP